MKTVPHQTTEKQRQINHAALTYLNMWGTIDRELVGKISSDSAGSAMWQLAKDYKVVRGIASRDQQQRMLTDAEKERRWDDIATLVKNHAQMTDADPVVVENLAHALREQHGSVKTNVLTSAATKFLWFAGRHSVRIYDERAKEALHLLTNGRSKHKQGYEWFATSWAKYEAEHDAELRSAIDGLENQLSWSALPEELGSEARICVRNTWFRDRVFDQYLWAKGAKKQL